MNEDAAALKWKEQCVLMQVHDLQSQSQAVEAKVEWRDVFGI